MQLKKRKFVVPPNWQGDLAGCAHRSNFRARVFNLIFSADAGNLAKLKKAFPEEVAVHQTWFNDPEGKFPTEVEIEVVEG